MTMAERTTMSVDMGPGESLVMGDVVVEFVHKAGRRARVRVTAPPTTAIRRELPKPLEKNRRIYFAPVD